MNRLKKLLSFALTALLITAALGTLPADAQLVLVESKYRIVDVDKFENRIAVALPDTDPDVAQTWVYIKRDTRGSMRTYTSNGAFRDEILTPEGILRAAERREGELIKINGGRDWDGSIDAKSVWM